MSPEPENLFFTREVFDGKITFNETLQQRVNARDRMQSQILDHLYCGFSVTLCEGPTRLALIQAGEKKHDNPIPQDC